MRREIFKLLLKLLQNYILKFEIVYAVLYEEQEWDGKILNHLCTYIRDVYAIDKK
jgi:hypothetical protein